MDIREGIWNILLRKGCPIAEAWGEDLEPKHIPKIYALGSSKIHYVVKILEVLAFLFSR
ncbi:MAG: hypothetical protein HY619_03435 [Thaumarchaeota archaeon]|nr:hypothetical protein [Nitrososphaerota archaeon]